MTEQRRHVYFVLCSWACAALVLWAIVYGILWGVRVVVARIESAL